MSGMATGVDEQQRQRKRGSSLSGLQIMFAAILAIGLLLAINFSSRIAAGQPLQEAYNRVQAEIDGLREEQAALMAERDYVLSDAFVEMWARDEGRMVREGEVLVIPVPVEGGAALADDRASSRPGVALETTPPGPEPWHVWWALFFDGPPPQLGD
jgi:cell division protein FtsB